MDRLSRCARDTQPHELQRIHTRVQRNGLRDAAGGRLRHQVRFGCELLVEAPVGETGGRHEIGHADPVVAPFPEQHGGRLDDVRPVGLRLRLGDFHGAVIVDS